MGLSTFLLLSSFVVRALALPPTISWATNSNPVQCGQASVEWETSSDQLLSAYYTEYQDDTNVITLPVPNASAGQSGTLTFTVGFAEEMSIVVVITDSFGTAQTTFMIVGEGTTTSCLNALNLAIYTSESGSVSGASSTSSSSSSKSSSSSSSSSLSKASSTGSSTSTSSGMTTSTTSASSSASTGSGSSTGSSSTSSPSSSGTAAAASDSSNGPLHSDTGAIAGGVVGGLAALIVVGLSAYFYRRRQNALESEAPYVPPKGGLAPHDAAAFYGTPVGAPRPVEGTGEFVNQHEAVFVPTEAPQHYFQPNPQMSMAAQPYEAVQQGGYATHQVGGPGVQQSPMLQQGQYGQQQQYGHQQQYGQGGIPYSPSPQMGGQAYASHPQY